MRSRRSPTVRRAELRNHSPHVWGPAGVAPKPEPVLPSTSPSSSVRDAALALPRSKTETRTHPPSQASSPPPFTSMSTSALRSPVLLNISAARSPFSDPRDVLLPESSLIPAARTHPEASNQQPVNDANPPVHQREDTPTNPTTTMTLIHSRTVPAPRYARQYVHRRVPMPYPAMALVHTALAPAAACGFLRL